MMYQVKKRRDFVMKKIVLSILLISLLLPFFCVGITAQEDSSQSPNLGISAKSAVLMEAQTGEILYAQNETEALPPASVTKIMTLLLVMEALRDGKIRWEDTVTVSDRAAAMGGSQIFLESGESMSVKDMVKSVVIASANDAAVALAEHIAGSEEAFVEAMNRRAATLGMTSTHFENTNGLDDSVENHVTSAKDIALMSRALIAFPEILEFSSTWMDTVRDGAFALTNTNRLVRFYPGATGLKTGSTAKAKFCISATAERGGVSLIAVIMGAETRDVRNAEAKKLLDYGFAHYGLYKDEGRTLDPLSVVGGMADTVKLSVSPFSRVLPKEKISLVTYEISLPSSVGAPILVGDKIGEIRYFLEGEELGKSDILAAQSVESITFGEMFLRLLRAFTLT